ncbi:MAG: hypothetical protein AAFW46_17045 [Pseudomonadota bacterium]
MVRRIGFGDGGGEEPRKKPRKQDARRIGPTPAAPPADEKAPSRAPRVAKTPTPAGVSAIGQIDRDAPQTARPWRDAPSSATEPRRPAVARSDRAALFRLILAGVIAAVAAQRALDRLPQFGSLDAFLLALEAGALTPGDLIWAVGPPVAFGVVAYLALSRLFSIGARRGSPGDAAPEPAYEEATPRDARRAFEQLRKERPDLAESVETASSIASGCGRLFMIGFLSLWLTGWSAGIYFAATEFWRGFSRGEFGGDTLFLGFWVTVASVAWAIAMRVLIGAIRGEDLSTLTGKRRR